MECKYHYQFTRIVKPIPLLFKICSRFNRHFFCHSFGLLFIINLIGEGICYSNKDIQDTINNIMRYNIGNNYNNCLIIPNLVIILITWYSYIKINNRLLQTGNVSYLSITGTINTINILGTLLTYLLPTYILLIYLLSINYIYIKYFKAAISDYSMVNEIINEYSDGVITNPCQTSNDIATEDIIENSESCLDVTQSDGIETSTNYSNIETDDDDHELDNTEEDDNIDEDDDGTVYLV
jgi:hypothetical protein